MSGFKITEGKGFHVTFNNGWTASVQFGPYNYCANRELPSSQLAATALALGARESVVESATAEIAAWDASDEWMQFDSGDAVDGWKTPAEVLAFLNVVAAK